EINKISQHPYLTVPASAVRVSHRALPLPRTDELGKLFVLIRSAFGTDLSYYKRSTLERRIERRMIVARIEHLDDYVRYVQNNTSELESLYKDCLIGVTSFFRDHEPFEALKAEVLPEIFERKRAGVPLRVWVPGCATGEEAYSIVMCVFEYLEGKTLDGKMQVFATDLDADA